MPENFTLGNAYFGVLRDLPNGEGEARGSIVNHGSQKGSWERMCFLHTERGRKMVY